MATDVPPRLGPVAGSDRYLVMDVLRGVALFGVLTVNLTGLGGEEFLATGDQLAALPSAAADKSVGLALSLFVNDKANTLFAFLFGLGFWIQMERLEARGAPFRSTYLRRVGLLFILGLIHLFGLFAWDILHLYGAVGFLLFFSRKMPERHMLWIGLILLVLGRPLVMWTSTALGIADPAFDHVYSNSAVLARQEVALAGDYATWISFMNYLVRYDWFASGLFIGWTFYVLGRFFLGAFVARKGWIQNAGDHLPMFRRALWPFLVAGLALEGSRLMINEVPEEAWSGVVPYASDLLHAVATPLIAAGYVCAIILVFHGRTTAWLLRPFAPVGQMALTNYLLQSAAIMLVLTNVGPGLGLAGQAGTTTYFLISIVIFGAQTVFSHVWMKSFAYGPAEWIWRTLTYGAAPRLRRAPQPPVQPLAPTG